MAISTQNVLKKMSNEIQEAMLQHTDQQKVREHVRSVRLLADLLLEQEEASVQPSQSVQGPTAEEVRQMMGAEPSPSKSSASKDKIDHDEANGPSIFDF
ncbi:hypothetical protein EQV77_08170 [Halobacillus fulvus]|nr:hypothetical protein EQV77_08170 [Halobacillus fulvus]